MKRTEPGFRVRVYEVVAEIPRGRVLGYGHVAALIGEPRKARQVGYAMAAIEPGSELPWWRVIRSDGSIALRGDPIRGPIQVRCLEEEGVEFRNDRVPMRVYRWNP